jgi:NAD(P)-dependent dehydrogenase (short-subunit alcohol dehydrogenase family)
MAGAIYPSLQGKTVFITGGAMGIGEGFVKAFHGQGCKVAFVDLAKEAGETLATSLGGAVWFRVCDVTDTQALQDTVRAVGQELGPVSVLVNNAAHDERHTWEDVTPEYWDNRLAINLKHLFFAAQAAIPMMKETGGGSIINLGSTSWKIGQGGMVAYTTAKSAMNGLTRSLARDLGPYNIRVNTLLPGWIMTERQLRLWVTPEGERKIMEAQCLKRKLYPEDISKVALFLASDEAGACTNQEFIVDGGWI